jgi:hypothetical protein
MGHLAMDADFETDPTELSEGPARGPRVASLRPTWIPLSTGSSAITLHHIATRYVFTAVFAVLGNQLSTTTQNHESKTHFLQDMHNTSRKSIRPDSKSDNTTKVLSNVDE